MPKKTNLKVVKNEDYLGHLRVSIVDGDNLHYEFLAIGFAPMEDTDMWCIYQKGDEWPIFMIPGMNIKHVHIEDLRSEVKMVKDQTV